MLSNCLETNSWPFLLQIPTEMITIFYVLFIYDSILLYQVHMVMYKKICKLYQLVVIFFDEDFFIFIILCNFFYTASSSLNFSRRFWGWGEGDNKEGVGALSV